MRTHDTAEAGLIDITRYRVAERAAEPDDSGLGRAMRRLLELDDEDPHRGFSNTI